MWDIVSTEFLWTLSIQVSKNTTTKKQTVGASNTANEKDKIGKGNNFWYNPLWLVPGSGGQWRQKESTEGCYLHAYFLHALTKSLEKASSFFKNYGH